MTHTVVVDPITAELFEHLVDLAHEEAEAYLGHEEFPLVEGRPLAPGARYATPGGTTEFTVEAWQPGVRTAGTYAERDESQGTFALTGELSGGRSSRALSVSVEAEPGPGGFRLRRTGGDLSADVAAWWAGVARDREDTAAEPVVSGRLRHPMVRVWLDLTPGPGPDGRWSVRARLRVRGRGFGWLISVFTFLGWPYVRRLFAREAEKVARTWDERVALAKAMTDDELRAVIRAQIRFAAGQSSRNP